MRHYAIPAGRGAAACHDFSAPLQPREQAARRGVEHLSDLDLVQLLLGSGGPGRPVRQLAAEVLAQLEAVPGRPDPERLRDIPGMGMAKSSLVCGAVELARRLYLPERRRVRLPADAWNSVRHFADRKRELFVVLSLNGAHELLDSRVVSVGTVNRSLVHPREVFADAISQRATAIIAAHNHPSGKLEPSPDDRAVTRRLAQAGDILGIPLLDHLVFSDEGWWSFADHGEIERKEAEW